MRQTEKLKIAVFPIIYKMWFFSSKKTVSKIEWYLSGNLTFQNLLRKRKLLPAENFWNILAFDKESSRKLLNLTSADSFIKNNNVYIYDYRVEISIIPIWKNFWFQKNFIQILWIFCWSKYILVRLRVFVSLGWVKAELAVHAL